MKKLLLLSLYLICINVHPITLKKIVGIDDGWSFFFINENKIITTEKTGSIKLFDIKNKRIENIKHNLSINTSGQGALMDIISHNGIMFVSYSEKCLMVLLHL